MEIKANIVITLPSGDQLSLTEEDAKKLYAKLSEFFGNNTQYYPIYIEPQKTYPNYPDWNEPVITCYSKDSSNDYKIDKIAQ